MSVHASLSPEAIQRLERQRRTATITSLLISLLSLTLIALILAFILLPSMVRENPTIVSYQGSNAVTDTPEKTKLSTAVRPSAKPSASAASAKAIIAQTASPVSVPVPDIAFEGETFGNSGDFGDGGDGFGDGTGSGSGDGGGGGGFGSSNPSGGKLEGHLYDFKQKPDGSTIDYNLQDRAEYVDRLVRLQRSDFSAASLKRHFKAPQTLYLSHIAIPLTDASAGPSYFGAADTIKPSGWLAHYKGKVRIPKTGTYRFSGLGDDYLSVLINGRPRLIACWSDIQEMIGERWDPSEPTGQHISPFSQMRIVYGDWVKLKEGEIVNLDIAVGERPGGKVGFYLQIEEKSAKYRTAPDGRPILPLFATAPIPAEEQERITKGFGSYEFDWDQPIIFPAQ